MEENGTESRFAERKEVYSLYAYILVLLLGRLMVWSTYRKWVRVGSLLVLVLYDVFPYTPDKKVSQAVTILRGGFNFVGRYAENCIFPVTALYNGLFLKNFIVSSAPEFTFCCSEFIMGF